MTTPPAGPASATRAPVSVIVPCYNAARFVGEAIETLLGQSLAPAQIVVVDDGSTDGSGAIVAAFGERVQCIAQANGGIAAARNAGLAAATQPLIAFLDADDLWPPTSLATRLARLEADATSDVVYGEVETFVDGDPALLASVRIEPAREARLAGSLLVRRALFERIGVFDTRYRVGETMDWIARAQGAGARFAGVAEIVLRRRIHGANTTARQALVQSEYLRVLRARIGRQRQSGTNE